jgi:hypothetical protein
MDAKEEAIHREFYARSRDIIRVYNPLDIDFRFKFDSVWYRVPTKGTKDFERYLAGKYFHDISQYIIGHMAWEAGSKMLEDREKKGLQPFLNKYDENRAIWDNTPKMDNKDLLNHIADEVLLGLVERFGSEVNPEEEREPQRAVDLVTPLTDQIVEGHTQEPAREGPASPTENKPVIASVTGVENKTSEELAAEVTIPETEKPPLYISKKDKTKK